MSKKIALYGGTFDPPHNGHIHLIVSAMQLWGFDEIWVVPAEENPLKPSSTSAEYRLAMSRLAFEPFPYCRVLDVECARPGPSYTVDTIQWLLEHDREFASAERYLLVGSDVAASFPKWKGIASVLHWMQPAVSEVNQFAICSTLVRQFLEKGWYAEHLLPKKVLEYVREHKLYGEK